MFVQRLADRDFRVLEQNPFPFGAPIARSTARLPLRKYFISRVIEGLLGFYRTMAGGVVLGGLALLGGLLSGLATGRGAWPLAVPLAALWIGSPANCGLPLHAFSPGR